MLRKFASFCIILVLCLNLFSNAFAEGLKIGSVNMKKMFFEYKKTKNFNKNLEEKDEAVKKEIDKKTQEIRKLRDEIDLLSEEAKEKRQPELRQKIKELDDLKRNKVEEFLREKDDMFREIRGDILSTSKGYAKKNGYDIIFDGSVFIYSLEKYDITDELLKELNK